MVVAVSCANKSSGETRSGSVGLDYKPIVVDLVYYRSAKGKRPCGSNAGFPFDPPMIVKESVISDPGKLTISGNEGVA